MVLAAIRVVILLFTIYHTWGMVNLAYNKPARQISTHSGDVADKAVDGFFTDFSHTSENFGDKWWMVDLQAIYSIKGMTLYNRQGFESRLAKISILTATDQSPGTPSLTSSSWTARNYREEAYGINGSIPFHPPIEAWHVAVYSNNRDEPLTLVEVQVFEDHNYASGKAVEQSTTYRSNLAAGKAIDGNFNTFSATNFQGSRNNQWWKVDLGTRILLREIVVYVRDGFCPTSGSDRCSLRLSDVYFLTNYRDATAAPNTDGTDDWSICYRSETALGDNYTVQCTGYANPVTRLFSIRTNMGRSVELREVVVHGYEAPVLSGDIAGASEQATTNSITISFSQWNQQMTGELPPSSYTVEVVGGNRQTVPHNSNSSRLSTTFNGLDVGQIYTFTVSCTIQGIACTGSTHSFTASTSCAVPDEPKSLALSALEVQHSSRQMWRYSAQWEAPNKANCYDRIQYQYNLVGQPTALQTTTTTTATFYLDGDVPFEFIVKAENSVGFSTPRSQSGRSDVLKPQFTAGQVTVTGINSSCVAVMWETPTYPGGTIDQYQYNCGNGQWNFVTNGSGSNKCCGYQPNFEVTCQVKASNSRGYGTALASSGRTSCDSPVFTQAVGYTDRIDDQINRWDITISVNPQAITINCDTLQSLEYKVDGTAFTTGSTFINLNALTSYQFTVKATNNGGNISLRYVTVVTGELKPDGGPQITMNRTNHSCVDLEWGEPRNPNGEIVGYRHNCSGLGLSPHRWSSTQTNSITYCRYEAGAEVTCDIQASTSVGFGPSTTIQLQLQCEKPSAPVFHLTTFKRENKTASLTITLSESKPYCRSIQRYIIRVRSPSGVFVHNQTTRTSGSYTVNDLFGFTNYTVIVEAINNEGHGSESTQYIVSAETHVPEAPVVEDSSTNVTCVTIAASQPTKPNGVILSYEFSCTDGTFSISTNSRQPTTKLCGFLSATQVNCSVAAMNSIGIGQLQNTSICTQIVIIDPIKAQPQVANVPKKSKDLIITITINPIHIENTEVSTYMVLLSKIEARKKRSYTCPNCYTAAEISADEVVEGFKFNVGDNEEYGGYINHPLDEESKYYIYLGIQAIVPGSSTPLVTVLDPVTITVPKLVKATDAEIAAYIVGGVTFMVISCAVVYLFLRFRDRLAETKDRNLKDTGLELDSQPPNSFTPPTPLSVLPSAPLPTLTPATSSTSLLTASPVPSPTPPRINRSGSNSNKGKLISDNLWSQSEAVPVHKLEWYVKTNTEIIKRQYKELNKLPAPDMSAALLGENKEKCRYKGLYPSDKHRVHLQRNGDNETDFINASFMKGYAQDDRYIAVQGPFTDAVVEDFWLMIWQQRPSAIVMVTRAIESTKMKCKQYWPLEKGVADTFGDIEVSLMASEMYSDFCLNHLEVTKNGERRIIPHFNYLYWPDHGVPDVEAFVSFHRLISSTVSHVKEHPLLVHCSAGVGRTGTYIALDYLLEQAKAEGVVDMFDCVKVMRARRPCMIQTVEQYVLLHQALYESLATESFSCLPADIDSKFLSHEQHAATQSNVLHVEYRHAINRYRSFSYAAGKVPKNKHKNRFFDILPDESAMPYLKHGVNGNYINAVFVDGYTEKNQWIATQLPLSNTIADFWQLILEQDIKIIVQLEGDQTPFYPLKDGTDMKVEPFIIKRVDSVSRDVLKTVNLLLQTKKECRSVSVLLLKSWISETLPSTEMIISLQEAAEKVQQQTSSRKLCVTCLDGSSRCGLFICAYNAIEKLKAEQVIDLYYPMVMAKQRRPQFIPTIEQYSFLYQVLIDYLNAFEDYCNFR